MVGWLEDVAGPGFAAAVLWTLLALVLLVIVLVIIRLVRSLTFGTFVVGGKNRKTRLAVMDAAPVDSHRRLVLVRRDDVEHLILIGGPTDVVIEQHIRAGVPQQARRPAAPEGSPEPAARPRPTAPAPVQASPRQPEAPMRGTTPPPPAQPMRGTTPPPPARPVEARVEPRPALPKAPPPVAPTVNTASPASKRNGGDDLDDALAHELAVSLEPPKKKKPELSLEDEMNKLLGELTAKKK